MSRLSQSVCLLLLALIFDTGCGGTTQHEQSRETAAEAYQAGLSSLDAGDYSAAIENLTVALDGGWLGYSTANAYIKRAEANAKAGNLDAALADLSAAEQGEGVGANMLAVKSHILEKQGKSSEAKAAWSQAQRLDRSVKKIED